MATKKKSRYTDPESITYRKQQILEGFWARQTTTSYQVSRQMALENRQLVDALTATTFGAISNVAKDFRVMLKKRFRCIRAAWEEHLDPLGKISI